VYSRDVRLQKRFTRVQMLVDTRILTIDLESIRLGLIKPPLYASQAWVGALTVPAEQLSIRVRTGTLAQCAHHHLDRSVGAPKPSVARRPLPVVHYVRRQPVRPRSTPQDRLVQEISQSCDHTRGDMLRHVTRASGFGVPPTSSQCKLAIAKLERTIRHRRRLVWTPTCSAPSTPLAVQLAVLAWACRS
jgi:hypothetical protein